jgi:plasmid maintenance system antidote protein VapI
MIGILVEYMRLHKYTSKKMSKAIGVSTYSFSRMLNGKTKMDIDTYFSAMKEMGYRAIFIQENQLK